MNELIEHSPESDLEEIDRPAYGVQWGLAMIGFAFAALVVARLLLLVDPNEF